MPWRQKPPLFRTGNQDYNLTCRLPFPVIELHPDNGSEFFNDHLVCFWGEEITGLRLSRSRPYHNLVI